VEHFLSFAQKLQRTVKSEPGKLFEKSYIRWFSGERDSKIKEQGKRKVQHSKTSNWNLPLFSHVSDSTVQFTNRSRKEGLFKNDLHQVAVRS